MKILFLHHLADLYGSSQSLARLTAGLVRAGDEVHVLLQEDGPLTRVLREAGAQVDLLPTMPVLHRNRLRTPAALLHLLRDARRAQCEIASVLDRIRPDLVHTNTAVILPVAGAPAQARNIPHLVHIRETFSDFGPLWPPYRAWIARRANRIACISEYLAGMFTPHQRATQVRVIHNGIPRSEFEGLDPDAIRRFRAPFEPGPVIVLVGRIKLVRKGQDVLVRAAGLLKDRFPRAQYVLVGAPFPGNEHHVDQLRAMARECGVADRIHFTGHLDNPKIAIAACEVSVMASSTPEPLGNVTIESMALGRPLVATNIGGTPELVQHEKTGLLIPPNDPAAMADAIARLLSNPEAARAMGTAARAHFERELEFGRFFDHIRALYQELAAS